jgi:hypothetical protein
VTFFSLLERAQRLTLGPAMDPNLKDELIRAGMDGWTPNRDVLAPPRSSQGARPMIGGWLALLLIVVVFAFVAGLFALGWLQNHNPY